MIERLAEPRRREYLRALGIDVWLPQPRPAPGEITPAEPEVAPAEKNAMTAETETSTTQSKHDDVWALLQHEVSRCTRCRLHETRTQPVFGSGDRHARLMIIGEAPGAEEDRTGEPFVGRAGQLLTAMLRAIGIEREQAFIANTLKCRPPQNRDPRADETAACSDYLARQIEWIRPSAILAVGRIAAQQLLQQDVPLGRLRGATHTLDGHGLPVVVTYHPAYLLRTPAQKALAWQDLKRVRKLLEQAA